MAAKAAMLAKPPGRLEFWAVFVAAVALTGWSIAMALEACVGTLNVADFGSSQSRIGQDPIARLYICLHQCFFNSSDCYI